MITLQEFIAKIKLKDVEGNRTYITAIIDGCKYGQSYLNTDYCNRKSMINDFVTFYYQLYQNKHL